MNASPPRPRPRANRDIFLVVNAVDELGGATGWAHSTARLFTERGHRVRVVGIAPAPAELRHELPSELPYAVTTLHERHPGAAWNPRAASAVAHPRRTVRELRRRTRCSAAVDRLNALLAEAAPGGVVINVQIWAMEWTARADTAHLHTIGMSHESYEATRHSSRYPRVRRYYADVDRMLVLTQEDADAWIHDGMNRTGAIPNPLPFTRPEPAPRKNPVVSAIGRLAPEKGLDQLLDAWSMIYPSFPDWELRLHGSGRPADEAELRRQAISLGLANCVRFAGRTDDVAGVLAETSVLALPSRAEGFPLTLLEAMASGVPCVAYDIAPGVREIIEDGVDGLLAPPGDIYTFTDHLRALMTDPSLRDRLGDKAFHAIQRYAPEEILTRWERLFALLDR